MIPQEIRETFEAILSGRVLLYKLFHKTFGREPDAAFLQVLSNPAVKDAFSLFSVEEDDMMSKAGAFAASAGEKAGDSNYLSELYNEYMRLFIGPQKLIAPPWESVYRSKSGLLFQENTLTVRDIYHKHGFQPEGYPHVPDDSLALELDFMGRMAERSLAALTQGNSDEFTSSLATQESFLRIHLLFFLPKLLERMEHSAFRLFYPQMTRILLAFAQMDLELVQDMMKAEI